MTTPSETVQSWLLLAYGRKTAAIQTTGLALPLTPGLKAEPVRQKSDEESRTAGPLTRILRRPQVKKVSVISRLAQCVPTSVQLKRPRRPRDRTGTTRQPPRSGASKPLEGPLLA